MMTVPGPPRTAVGRERSGMLVSLRFRRLVGAALGIGIENDPRRGEGHG
jgi:hypothetical protein